MELSNISLDISQIPNPFPLNSLKTTKNVDTFYGPVTLFQMSFQVAKSLEGQGVEGVEGAGERWTGIIVLQHRT